MHAHKPKKDGAFGIIEDTEQRILMGRAAYGAKLLQLPGGGVERGELPSTAAANEILEETGLFVSRENLTLIAILGQLRAVWEGKTIGIAGNVFLYHVTAYEGDLFDQPDDEILERKFLSVEEIIAGYDQKRVARGAARMVLIFDAIRRGTITRLPYEGMLADLFPVQPFRFI
jgi:8-oxo-dGTP pyrophosphatase MutT (NUDIX family)